MILSLVSRLDTTKFFMSGLFCSCSMRVSRAVLCSAAMIGLWLYLSLRLSLWKFFKIFLPFLPQRRRTKAEELMILLRLDECSLKLSKICLLATSSRLDSRISRFLCNESHLQGPIRALALLFTVRPRVGLADRLINERNHLRIE